MGGRLRSCLVVALGASLAGPGCSYIFVQGPPPPNAVQVDCVGGYWAPAVDTVVAGVMTTGLFLTAGASDADYEGGTFSRNQTLGIGAAMLAVFGSSAILGYLRVSECRAAKDEQNLEIARQHGYAQLYERQRAKAASPPPAGGEGTVDWPEDDAIADAFKRKVMKSCWLKPPGPAPAQPCVLKGDFDGDGRPDKAVLVIEARLPARKGIVLLTSDAEPVVLGAGTIVGNGGDDFSWMDSWRVVKKAETTRLIGRAAGDGLVVEKAESAGGLIAIVDGWPKWAQWSD